MFSLQLTPNFQRLLIELSRDARLMGLTVHQRQFASVCKTSSVCVDPEGLLDWPDVGPWQNALVLVRQAGSGKGAKVGSLCVLIVGPCHWKSLISI